MTQMVTDATESRGSQGIPRAQRALTTGASPL